METLAKSHIGLHPDIHRGGVLVVEDSDVQRQSVVEMLRAIGVCRIYEAGDGQAGLELARSLYQPPALVILDLEMPGMDGIEMAQQLVTAGLRPSLMLASAADPVILASVELMLDALNLPLLGVISKPVTLKHLQEAIASYEAIDTPRAGNKVATNTDVTVEMLSIALRERCIRPFYQPKLQLDTGTVTGLEALARWKKNDGKLISPCDFIGLAEQSNLIDRMTLSILDSVLEDLTTWHSQGYYPTVAINVSAHTLTNKDFPNEVIRRLEQANVSPTALVLEITESALVSDMALAVGALGRLRLKGIGLSIDDYGTGFSSMQQLSRLPFSELKIDRSFVRRADEKRILRVMLESALQMSRQLGLSAVAEGIETCDELKLVASLGCTYAQGYLVAVPMPAEELIPWILDNEARIGNLCK